MRHLILASALLLFIAHPVIAAVVSDLHRASIAVEDHSARQLQRASRAGLAQALLKLSGSRESLRQPDIRAALDRPEGYLQQYQYRTGNDGELFLDIQFDQDTLTELLIDAGQPLWPVNRPIVLVWLVVDEPGGRHHVDADDPVAEAVRALFARRGVPIEFPLYDLQDRLAAGIHDLWELNILPVHRASQRYQAQHILVARLTASTERLWLADWLYLFEAETAGASAYGEELELVVNTGVELVAQSMAARYAVAPNQKAEGTLLLQVDGLQQYLDYRNVLSHLENVALVSSARLEFMRGGSGIFRVLAPMQQEQLRHALSLKGRLVPLTEPDPLDSGLGEIELVYRWNR